MKDLRKIMESRFSKAMKEADLKEIEDIKNGVIKLETIRQKPEVPSLDNKVITISYKDPEAVSNAVEYFVDEMIEKIKNGSMIREEIEAAIYNRIADIGEQIEVRINLKTGQKELVV
jgi:basic membrane lipoprotein Med (substrate-binding protein (PBP1-ABC) superfamily)